MWKWQKSFLLFQSQPDNRGNTLYWCRTLISITHTQTNDWNIEKETERKHKKVKIKLAFIIHYFTPLSQCLKPPGITWAHYTHYTWKNWLALAIFGLHALAKPEVSSLALLGSRLGAELLAVSLWFDIWFGPFNMGDNWQPKIRQNPMVCVRY